MPVGSCGFPRTGMEVAILDLDGNPLPPDATGEICVRGPGVFAGYHNNPEATAQATRFGWFHTGDLGHMDAQGLRVSSPAARPTCTSPAVRTCIRARSRRCC